MSLWEEKRPNSSLSMTHTNPQWRNIYLYWKAQFWSLSLILLTSLNCNAGKDHCIYSHSFVSAVFCGFRLCITLNVCSANLPKFSLEACQWKNKTFSLLYFLLLHNNGNIVQFLCVRLHFCYSILTLWLSIMSYFIFNAVGIGKGKSHSVYAAQRGPPPG